MVRGLDCRVLNWETVQGAVKLALPWDNELSKATAHPGRPVPTFQLSKYLLQLFKHLVT